MMTQPARLWRTVRHLRSQQVLGQVRVRMARLWCDPARLLKKTTPPWPGVRWRERGDWLAPGEQNNDAHAIRSGSLCFVGETRQVGWPPRWADDASTSRLWQYNLHYLEYLWALPYDDARMLASDWIAHHPPGRGRVGWEPYPTSLRLMNLCCVMFGRFRSQVEADEPFRDALWASVHRQTRWLSANLETHIQANHLLENAAALALAGACFNGPQADHWRHAGLALLERELAEQVLADGGHYERSPMYHLRVMYVLAMLVNTGEQAIVQLCAPVLTRTLQALRQLCHTDGQIALLNDSALGVYNPPGELMAYVRRLLEASQATDPGQGHFALPATGYYSARNAAGDYVLCDAAPIGPDHQPGHAHADLLSLEMSCRGKRLLIDAGVYDYEPSAMRAYCRSTRAHNTVEIQGRDQCELWGAFRVGRRARVRDVQWRTRQGGFVLEAWHDGYTFLPGRPIHRREFAWHDAGVLLVRDRVQASAVVTATARWRVHPDWKIREMNTRQLVLECDGQTASLWFVGDAAPQLDDAEHWYCPRFGQRQRCQVIKLQARGKAVVFGFAVCADKDNAALDLDEGLRLDGHVYGW